MARLPQPGGDNGTWGDVLNGFLSVEHNSDGSLKNSGTLADYATKEYADSTAAAGTPDATASTKGKIQLAGDLTGTATSPQIAAGAIVDSDVNASAAIAQSKVANLITDLSNKQPLDSDLTAIAAITPTNDDIIQRKSGAWVNRTPGQLASDMGAITQTGVNFVLMALSASNTGLQNDAAWDAAVTAAGTSKRIVMPAGSFTFATKRTWSVACPMLEGQGANATQLNFASNSDHGVVLGSSPTNTVPAGWARDFSIVGPTARPSRVNGSVKSAFRLNGQRLFSVERVNVANWDVGFDLVNNCYGTQFTQCSSIFSTCNIAVNLREGAQSGSDLVFNNCWMHGEIAAYCFKGGGGGYHIQGGQASCNHGLSGTVNDIGIYKLGWDYENNSVNDGVGIVTIRDVDNEGWWRGWAIRTHGLVQQLSFDGCSFIATVNHATNRAKGFLYVFDPKSSQFSFKNCHIGGYFTGNTAALIDGGGTWYDNHAMFEDQWSSSASVINGVSVSDGWLSTIAAREHYGQGVGRWRGGDAYFYEQRGQLLLRTPFNGASFEKSTNWGSSWAAV